MTEVIECAECGYQQRLPELAAHQRAHCARCDGILACDRPRAVERAMALTIAALTLLAIANFAEFMTFEFKGRAQDNHIVTGVLGLTRLGYGPLAALILFASVVAPLLHLSGTLCVLASLSIGRCPAWLGPLYRRLEALRPWSMLEVYLLGTFVAVIKLGQLASLELGIAFWAYLALIPVAAASYDAMDARVVWAAVDRRAEATTP